MPPVLDRALKALSTWSLHHDHRHRVRRPHRVVVDRGEPESPPTVRVPMGKRKAREEKARRAAKKAAKANPQIGHTARIGVPRNERKTRMPTGESQLGKALAFILMRHRARPGSGPTGR